MRLNSQEAPLPTLSSVSAYKTAWFALASLLLQGNARSFTLVLPGTRDRVPNGAIHTHPIKRSVRLRILTDSCGKIFPCALNIVSCSYFFCEKVFFLVFTKGIYNAVFHPLARFPGPRSAAISNVRQRPIPLHGHGARHWRLICPSFCIATGFSAADNQDAFWTCTENSVC